MKKKYLVVTISVVLLFTGILGIYFTSSKTQATAVNNSREYQTKLVQTLTESLKDSYHKGKPMRESSLKKPNGEVSHVKILKQITNESTVQVLYSFKLNNKLKYGLSDIVLDSWRVSRNTNLSPNSQPVQMLFFHTSKYIDVFGFVKTSDTAKTIRIAYENGETESIAIKDEFTLYYPKYKDSALKTIEVINQSNVQSDVIYPISSN